MRDIHMRKKISKYMRNDLNIKSAVKMSMCNQVVTYIHSRGFWLSSKHEIASCETLSKFPRNLTKAWSFLVLIEARKERI